MKKLNRAGELVEYELNERYFKPNAKNWIVSNVTGLTTDPNIECNCGSKKFGVCWWDYPYTGGYCKITCSECGEELVLIDDYS